MSKKVAAAIAGAFAAGVFVAAAPSAMGHGPGVDRDHGPMWADGRADHMAGACEQDEMFDHMSGAGSHMSGVEGDWMIDMMSGGGSRR